MKVIQLYFIFLIFIFASCGHKNIQEQKPDLICIQLVDRNGISETISNPERLEKYDATLFQTNPQPYKQILCVFSSKEKIHNFSKLTSYHPNGNCYKYLEIDNSRANGKYYEWHTNGQKKIDANVIGGPASLHQNSQEEWLFDNDSFAWDEEGNLIAEISYEKGLLSGLSLYYYPNGLIQKIVPYKKNEIDGYAVKYDDNKNIISIISYKNGIKDGICQGFANKTKETYFEDYKKGKLLSGKYFDQNEKLITKIENGEGTRIIFKDNTLWKKIEYHNGEAQGKIEEFTKDNELQNICFIKNGKKQDLETIYFLTKELSLDIERSDISKKPQPKLSFYWNEDSVHGTVKSWYNNGVLESQREISKNKKHGISSAWYRTGDLMLIEEYNQEQLKRGKYYKKNEKNPISTIINGTGTAYLYDGYGNFLRKVFYKKGKAEK
jgi:antitoxin component YwqK of YwqJK toxin-antitoxin module